MKKKFREIVVDGVTYAWRVNFNCDGDGGTFLTVWLNKRVLIDDKVNLDHTRDEEGNCERITPKLVAELIKTKIKL